MHEEQIPMQEWICMKCPHKSHVEVDQFLNRSTCTNLLRQGCQRKSFWYSQSDSQMYTFPDQMKWQFVQILMDSKFHSKLRVLAMDKDDVKQKTSLFSVQGNSGWYCFKAVGLFFTSSMSVTQNKCQNSHHNHPRHPFIIWIYRECKAQNGLIL